MVGVPSSRACDACRAQRKKCLGQSSPCSRCRRLKISCVGFGLHRYKFVAERHPPSPPKDTPNHTTQEKGAVILSKPQQINEFYLACPSKPLSNRVSLLTSVIAGTISPSTPIRFQLPWSFGDFLYDIPCRIGQNEALDAAADALATAYWRYCGQNSSMHLATLKTHGVAIEALQSCLMDPVKAHSPETLAAIMLLLIRQALSGEEVPISHSSGAALVLKSRGYAGPRNDFERKVLLSLRGPVIMEAYSNPDLELTDQEWKDLVQGSGGLGVTPEEVVVQCMARGPALAKRIRCCAPQSGNPDCALRDSAEEAFALRTSATLALQTLRSRLLDSEPRGHARSEFIHANNVRMYTFALGIAITTNCLALTFAEEGAAIKQESAQYAQEIINMAAQVAPYRPIGTLWMTLSLSMAWVGASDPFTKHLIEDLIEDFRRDFHRSGAGKADFDSLAQFFDFGRLSI